MVLFAMDIIFLKDGYHKKKESVETIDNVMYVVEEVISQDFVEAVLYNKVEDEIYQDISFIIWKEGNVQTMKNTFQEMKSTSNLTSRSYWFHKTKERQGGKA